MATQGYSMNMLDDPTNTRRHQVTGLDGVKSATEASKEVACQASERSNATVKTTNDVNKNSIRAHLRIGTWNVNGILRPGKLSIIEKEMENTRLSILGISETHYRGQGHLTTATGNTLYFSGSKDASRNGVGILILSKLKKFVLGYNTLSDRVITMKLNTKPCVLYIIQIYAPTSQSLEEDIDNFYQTLERALKSIPTRETTIILGDWNGKVGYT